ncbi:ferrous iron transport protein A [Desulfotomaculum arcticum]|uniref:Ferrous iron transport protein A n=1 Tax=Desulfotruncus arcticus DSM 17038 TaxID=1121424 RepID=A0A1I2T2P1_9FIRM|nr:FeoA family protein [Desulfotruncus arcticus]SFG56551.1 ferrous iron transport protein A [Desulfotomaculum arcticum] [Desulfotruncus arcticus DSM 17038]
MNNKTTLTLSSLGNGSFALVKEVVAEGLDRRRLLDLGLVPGTRVEVIRRSPVGDPIAFNIRGAVIALRKEVASMVLVAPGNK